MGDYGSVNELIKLYENIPTHTSFWHKFLQGIKSSIQQKMTHVKTSENKVQILVIQKFVTIFWLKLL